MGRGFRKQRNVLKKQFLGSLQQYAQKLEQENEQLKTDPNTIVGQLIPQMREAMSQNKRLSVLCAALIKASGGKVTVSKDELESFKGYALSIKWELPEGVTALDDAKEYTFTYEAITEEEAKKLQEEAMASAEAKSATEQLEVALKADTEGTLDAIETVNNEAHLVDNSPNLNEEQAVENPQEVLGSGLISTEE